MQRSERSERDVIYLREENDAMFIGLSKDLAKIEDEARHLGAVIEDEGIEMGLDLFRDFALE